MEKNKLTEAQIKIIVLQDRIKTFTLQQPTNLGPVDPSYRSYLAQCSKLYELDKELTLLSGLETEPKELDERLPEIEKEVNRLTFSMV